MAQLNEDCLLEIFQLLSFEDQINMSLVCQGFQNIAQCVWRKKYKRVELNFYEIKLSNAGFRSFIECICATVESIVVKFLSEEKYGILREHMFPKVSDFRFSQQPPMYMGDEEILHISKIMPCIRHFSPQGNFSGEHFVELLHLESLKLCYCPKFEFDHIPEIFQRLTLNSLQMDIFDGYDLDAENFFVETISNSTRSLERIAVNYSELVLLLECNLLHLMTLRELTLNNENDGFLLAHLQIAAPDMAIESLEMSNGEFKDVCVFNCAHLERLSCVNMGNASFRLRTNEAIPTLRELKLSSCQVSSQDIRALLDLYCDVDLLSFECCNMECDTFVLDCWEVVRRRKKPLTFNFYGNFCESNLKEVVVKLEVQGNPGNLLQISCQRTTTFSYEPYKLTFRPSSS